MNTIKLIIESQYYTHSVDKDKTIKKRIIDQSF
jgi:hypothetical protein